MFYEAYFNHEGVFRGAKLKGKFLLQLFSLETVTRFEKSITYIQYILEPYRSSLGILPNQETPEVAADQRQDRGEGPAGGRKH